MKCDYCEGEFNPKLMLPARMQGDNMTYMCCVHCLRHVFGVDHDTRMKYGTNIKDAVGI